VVVVDVVPPVTADGRCGSIAGATLDTAGGLVVSGPGAIPGSRMPFNAGAVSGGCGALNCPGAGGAGTGLELFVIGVGAALPPVPLLGAVTRFGVIVIGVVMAGWPPPIGVDEPPPGVNELPPPGVNELPPPTLLAGGRLMVESLTPGV
jgi:hypothetical protein